MLSGVPSAIANELQTILKAELKSFSFISGGCINNGGKLETSMGSFFLKWNYKQKFPGMFQAEAKGLKILAKPGVIDIPEVITYGEADQWQFLTLEFVEHASKSDLYWKNLGEQLAALHKNSSPTFGLDHNNYVGSLEQKNTRHENWINFFIDERLEVQLKLAIELGNVGHDLTHKFQQFYKKLPDLLPTEKPALLHGDLWSGNLITNSKGEPCIIDPAVYYGHREAELAFTTLFGGFDTNFYVFYNENFPLIRGYKERFIIYNLYPLMVHVNLFGGGYLSQVVSILRRFV
jgi:protein-ribulosamine 3-kinase